MFVPLTSVAPKPPVATFLTFSHLAVLAVTVNVVAVVVAENAPNPVVEFVELIAHWYPVAIAPVTVPAVHDQLLCVFTPDPVVPVKVTVGFVNETEAAVHFAYRVTLAVGVYEVDADTLVPLPSAAVFHPDPNTQFVLVKVGTALVVTDPLVV